MRVLLTGHTGYIGTVMVPTSAAEGHEVVGLDSDRFEQRAFCVRIPAFPEPRAGIRDVQQPHDATLRWRAA